MTVKKTALFLFIAFCFLKGDGLFSAVSSSKSDHIKLPVKGLCAHRGAMATHSENTLSALRAAVKAGAHMIEFDVTFTRDELIALMNDGTADRTTDNTGKVSELTFQDIRHLDAGSWKSGFLRMKSFLPWQILNPQSLGMNLRISEYKKDNSH